MTYLGIDISMVRIRILSPHWIHDGAVLLDMPDCCPMVDQDVLFG